MYSRKGQLLTEDLTDKTPQDLEKHMKNETANFAEKSNFDNGIEKVKQKTDNDND